MLLARLPILGLLLVSLASTGCAVAELFRDPSKSVAPAVRPDFIYEAVSDHYVELCAVSQYRPREGGELDAAKGGSPGHAVMYLKGACVDETAAYPRLRPCRRATADRSDPEHGAGVSVNRYFRNVNWVGTPGKSLFFDGGLSDWELLDKERWKQVVEEALALDMFRGIEFHPFDGETEPPSVRRMVENESLGTDFALRFGRTVFCTRLPMPEKMLHAAMEYLNALNDEYANGEADYNWNGLSDNCVHTLHNALAAAGVWKPKSVNAAKLGALANIAVPANTFVDLAYLANEFPLEDFDKVRKDELRWSVLKTHGWLPASPGGLVKMMPILQINRLYDTKYRMLVLGGFFQNVATERARRLLTDGRFIQLDANLRYYFDRYTEILEARDDSPSWRDRFRDDAYHVDREIYYAYIESQREKVRKLADLLRELDQARNEILEGSMDEWKARFEGIR